MNESENNDDFMTDKPSRFDSSTVLGLAVLGCYITGASGIIATFISMFRGDGIGAGISLVASAFAFGLLATAIFR